MKDKGNGTKASKVLTCSGNVGALWAVLMQRSLPVRSYINQPAVVIARMAMPYGAICSSYVTQSAVDVPDKF
ncbi:uncharacterized [Tachysurus ichikawai]